MAYVRVRDNSTGHEFTKSEEWVAAMDPDAITVLKSKDAVDVGGAPLPVKYREDIADAGARRTGKQRSRRTTKKSTAKRAAKQAATAPAAPTSNEETSE